MKMMGKRIPIRTKPTFNELIKSTVDELVYKANPDAAATKLIDAITGMSDNGERRSQLCNSEDDTMIGSFDVGARINNSGSYVQIGTSGDAVNIANSGAMTLICSYGFQTVIADCGARGQIASSGNVANIASSGMATEIGSSGSSANIASSGDSAYITSSGERVKIASSGSEARIKMEGYRSIATAIGINSSISGKKGDWIVLAEWKKGDDGNWYPACVKSAQIDGETLLEDVMYMLKDGEFVEMDP